MANNIVPSIDTLPVEILHRIFDHLDVQTIIFSIRLLSRLFRSITSTYNRYILDFQLISKENFYVLCRLINPQNVISLTLSNDERTSNQIDLFISLVHLKKFTRLHSLILDQIDEDQLNIILEHINPNTLTSLSFNISKYNDINTKTTINLLTSIISQPTLHKLDINIKSERMQMILWPINCSIHHLIIRNDITIDNLHTILQSSPYLHKLIIKGYCGKSMNDTIPISTFHTSFQQLTYLSIENMNISIERIEFLLLLTPSLIYLKLIGGVYILDGKRWEELIQLNLPHLDKFEFYFDSWSFLKTTLVDVELIIGSFQTPFWIEHKKWFVTCEYKIDNPYIIYLYTLPICKSSLQYISNSQKLFLSTNPIALDNYSTIMHNINSLDLTLSKFIANDIEKKKITKNHPMFPNVTKINVVFEIEFPLLLFQSLSIFINISQIVEMELSGRYFNDYEDNRLMNIDIFIKQAHNLSSFSIPRIIYGSNVAQAIENIHSIVLRHISRNIKHLHIPINNIDQIKIILDRCQDLFTIKLNFTYPKFFEKIIQWFNENTINSTCVNASTSVIVWIGKKQMQSIENHSIPKRIKLNDNNSNY